MKSSAECLSINKVSLGTFRHRLEIHLGPSYIERCGGMRAPRRVSAVFRSHSDWLVFGVLINFSRPHFNVSLSDPSWGMCPVFYSWRNGDEQAEPENRKYRIIQLILVAKGAHLRVCEVFQNDLEGEFLGVIYTSFHSWEERIRTWFLADLANPAAPLSSLIWEQSPLRPSLT